MATLTITKGPTAQMGKQFILKQRPLAGGRHPSQEIQLTDPEVSRRHFLIAPTGDTHTITETNAANGVRVNGQRIKEQALQEGDQIQVLLYSRLEVSDQSDAVQGQRRADRQMREGRTFVEGE